MSHSSTVRGHLLQKTDNATEEEWYQIDTPVQFRHASYELVVVEPNGDAWIAHIAKRTAKGAHAYVPSGPEAATRAPADWRERNPQRIPTGIRMVSNTDA